jgi:Response regulator of the LytR/AlgR family
MIRIAVCDDEEKELVKTKEICKAYMLSHPGYDLKIVSFLSAEELMLYINKQEKFDILLLDIYMPNITGTQLAHSLRDNRDECQIIFLTTSLNHAIEAFSLHAVHYLVKPYQEEQLVDALEKALSMMERNHRAQITLKTATGIQKINYMDFLYAETQKHNQLIHTADGKIHTVRITSNGLFELLSSDKRFYKCGSTYLINLGKIEEIAMKYILFENGEQIPMQRRQYREMVSLYTKYSLEES